MVHSWLKSPGPRRQRLQPTPRPPGRRLQSAQQSTHVPRGPKSPGQATWVYFLMARIARHARSERPSSLACPLRQAAGLEARRAVPGRLRTLPPPPEHLTRARHREPLARKLSGRGGPAPAVDVPGQPLTPVPAPALSAAQTQKLPWLEPQPRWPPDPCRDPGCTHWKSGGSGSRGGGSCPLVLAAAVAASLHQQLSHGKIEMSQSRV